MALSGSERLIIPFKSVRIIPYKNYPGNLNMAIDYYFSTQMNGNSEPIIRLYGWAPFCLSLGRHQDIGNVNFKKLQMDGFDVVRRPTGGSAIFHSEELTYSIVISKKLMHHKELYYLIHQILYRVLMNLGYKVELQTQNFDINYLKDGEATFICFNRSAYTELKFNNKKVVGSAQKIYPNAILQHGSILIGSAQNKISEYFGRNIKTYKNNLRLLNENSISLNKISNINLTTRQLSKCIIEEIQRLIDVRQKSLTKEEVASAKKYCSDFDIKNIN